MTPLKCRLECEKCGVWLVVNYDADVRTKLLSLQCRCGHTTPIKSVEQQQIEKPDPRYMAKSARGEA